MDLTINDERLFEDESETLYYGFSSTNVFEDMEFLLQNVLKKSLKSVEENLIDIKSSTEIEKNMLDTYMNKLYTKYMQSIEEVLKKFKLEVQRTFSIPKNVILPGTELQNKHKDKSYSNEDIRQLKRQVEDLKGKILTEQVFLNKLRQEKAFIDTKLRPFFENINRTISISKSISSGNQEKMTKILDLHEKSMKFYFDSVTENEHILYPEEYAADKRNFFD